MTSKRKSSPSSSSSSSSSSDSDSSSGSGTSSSSGSQSSASKQAIQTRERHSSRVPAKKRQRSPSPQAARQAQDRSRRGRQQSPRCTANEKRQEPSHRRNRRSRSPLATHKAADCDSKEMSRGKTGYGDRREDSRRDSRHEDSSRHRGREPAGRDKAKTDHLKDDHRDRQHSRSETGARHSDVVQSRSDRHHHGSSRDADINGSRGGQQNASRNDRRHARPDNQGSARDQAELPPPPPQPVPAQPEGVGRRPGGAANGNPGRQNRWAKDDDKGPEQWGKPGNRPDEKQGKEEKPEPEANFALSGKLAAETNTVKGVVLVHQEPPEARKPSQMWRLYGFKNGEPIDKPLYIHRQTCYLFGRERRVADVPLDHPSISKQHAVLQYRFTEKEGADGMMHSGVRPYLMDLGSANGTYLNNDRIEPERYYELLERDMIKFGHSTREYVLLHAQSNAGADLQG